jgi:Zn-dependent peptidase ImmA (M78 family)
LGFRLSDNRCEKIKKLVVDTFVRLNIRCVPISGFEIATKLGANIIPYSVQNKETQTLMMLRSEDGFTIKYDGDWYIYYNDKKGYGRINNTLTHEIAHIILNHTEESDLAEAEANFFAKYAIAPPVLIHELGLKNHIDIYNKFDISLEAATYAYNYYRKWLTYGNKSYTDYELRLIQLFKEAV